MTDVDNKQTIRLDTPRENTNNADNKSIDASARNMLDIDWSPDNEKILVEWCDVAQCYKWLNLRSHGKLSTMHAWFTIPAIIFSTVSGTASFAQESFPANIRAYAPAVIGTINITIGILTTIQQYLKISELNEAHRVSAISWDKFARNIRIELAKRPVERDNAGHFLKISRQEFDRLMETSPSINDKVIEEFKAKFSGKDGTPQRHNYDKLNKPDICDTIVSVDESRNKWYENIADLSSDVLSTAADAAIRSRDNFILEQKRLLQEKEAEIARHTEIQNSSVRVKLENVERIATRAREEDRKYNEIIVNINSYINGYYEIYARRPTIEELNDKFANEISKDVLDKFLTSYNQSENHV
jgi:hypothetical protein